MNENLTLNARYRLTDRLASGGMGEVWRAQDELLRRTVAVKLLGNQYVADPEFRQRFRDEARFAAALQHPCIAQVYDYGEHDDLAYLVMELVPGQPLSEILARNSRLSAEVTLDIVTQAARALQAAHSAGIIHRDVKPGNLILNANGGVKITDFGIARAAASSSASMTQSGMIMGTAHYVSPEQATDQPVTGASDVYSLGVVAYECLAGAPPFAGGPAVEIATKHVRDAPAALPDDVPPSVADLVMRMLAKDPGARPESADELADHAFVLRDSLALGGADPSDATQQASAPTGPATAPTEATPPAAATEQPADHGLDSLLSGSGPDRDAADEGQGGTRRAPILLLSAVGVAVLVLGIVMIGALWGEPDSAQLVEGGDGQPAPVVSTAPGTGGSELPTPSPHVSQVEPSPSESDTGSGGSVGGGPGGGDGGGGDQRPTDGPTDPPDTPTVTPTPTGDPTDPESPRSGTSD